MNYNNYGNSNYGNNNQMNNRNDSYNNNYRNNNYNNYENNQGDNREYYDYEPMNDSGFNLSTNKYDPNYELNGRELFCTANGDGHFFAKKGSMVAYQGNFKFSKRLLGTNSGNIVGQVMNHLGRRVTGENLEIMEVTGSGTIYLADKASHVVVLDLEMGQSLCVESEDLLAFTKSCHYGVCCVPMGTLSQKGLFTSKLTGRGQRAQVAIKTNGNPLVLQTPCSVDPDALVAWTGPSPSFGIDVNLKNLIGQASGESYRFDFKQPGFMVIVQPYERESGLKVAVDDKNHVPTGQGSSGRNTMDNLSNLGGSIGRFFR